MIRKICLSLLTVILIALLACKKNVQDTSFKDVPRIRLGGAQTETTVRDSTVFSFAPLPAGTTQKQLTLVARILGNASDVDRNFKIEVDAKNTNAVADEYELPPAFVIKAGAFTGNIPITVKKSPRINNMFVRLTLRLLDNENFSTSEESVYKFVWTNDVVKPKIWDSWFLNYSGKYSKVKHRFIIENTSYKDLNLITSSMPFEELVGTVLFIQTTCADALKKYNDTHTEPLKNEFNKAIGFCRGCE